MTLGIVWYIGALARKPDQPPYERRQVAVAISVTAAAFLALGLFGARPAAVFGVDGGSLQSSVGNDLLLDPGRDCEREGGAWTCWRWDNQSSGTVSYRVKANRFGCWSAVRVGYAGEEGSRKTISGCVTLYDFLFS